MNFEEEVQQVLPDLAEEIGDSDAIRVVNVFLRDVVCPQCKQLPVCKNDPLWIRRASEVTLSESDGRDLPAYLHDLGIPVQEGGQLARLLMERYGEPPSVRKEIYDGLAVDFLEREALRKAGFLVHMGVEKLVALKMIARFVLSNVCPFCIENQQCQTRSMFQDKVGSGDGPDIAQVMIRLGEKPNPDCSCPWCKIIVEKIAQGETQRPTEEVLGELGLDKQQIERYLVAKKLNKEMLGALSTEARGIPQA